MEENIHEKVKSQSGNLWLDTNKDVLNYLLVGRGLSNETIQSYQLGVDNQGNISIPIHDQNGDVIGIKYRSNPLKEYKQKYWHTTGLSNSIFNLHRLSKGDQIVLTEGEFDAMILCQLGFKAVSQTTGAGIQSDVIKTLLRTIQPKQLTIALDNDSRGREAMYKVATTIKNHDLPIRFVLPPKGTKDWTDLVVKGEAGKVQVSKLFSQQLTAKEFISSTYREFENGFIQTIAVSEIENQEMEYLAKPLFVKNGVNLLTAPPKSAKSMMTLHLLSSAMEGTDFLGFIPTSRIQKALLIDQESIKSQVRHRILKLGGDPAKFLMTTEPIYFDIDPDITGKIKELIDYEGVDLVVIDTLRRVNQNMDENSSKDVSKFFGAVIPIAEVATVIVIHHDNKSNFRGGNSSYRGSGDILGAVDSHVYIKKVSESSNRTVLKVTHPSARYSQTQEDMEVEFIDEGDSFRFNFLGETSANKLAQEEKAWEENQDSLLEFINTGTEQGKSTKDIEEFCKKSLSGMGQHRARELRDWLVEKGLIVRVDNFLGGKATHFLSKDFSTQQLSTLDKRGTEHEK